jgi:site-specific recombinase XerD
LISTAHNANTAVTSGLDARCLVPGVETPYGGGLRLMELLRLRVKDVDLEQEIITIRDGKGGKDRYVPLAYVVVEPLRAHLQKVNALYEQDRGAKAAGGSGCPRVWLANTPKRERNGPGIGSGRMII